MEYGSGAMTYTYIVIRRCGACYATYTEPSVQREDDDDPEPAPVQAPAGQNVVMEPRVCVVS